MSLLWQRSCRCRCHCQLVSELATQASEEEKVVSQQKEAAERFVFFQATRTALSDLCGMLREKVKAQHDSKCHSVTLLYLDTFAAMALLGLLCLPNFCTAAVLWWKMFVIFVLPHSCWTCVPVSSGVNLETDS